VENLKDEVFRIFLLDWRPRRNLYKRFREWAVRKHIAIHGIICRVNRHFGFRAARSQLRWRCI